MRFLTADCDARLHAAQQQPQQEAAALARALQEIRMLEEAAHAHYRVGVASVTNCVWSIEWPYRVKMRAAELRRATHEQTAIKKERLESLQRLAREEYFAEMVRLNGGGMSYVHFLRCMVAIAESDVQLDH